MLFAQFPPVIHGGHPSPGGGQPGVVLFVLPVLTFDQSPASAVAGQKNQAGNEAPCRRVGMGSPMLQGSR